MAGDHVVTVDRLSLRPLGCTCPAGTYRVVCYAVLKVQAEDLPDLAGRRLEAARAGYTAVGQRRDAALQALAERADRQLLARRRTASRGRAA